MVALKYHEVLTTLQGFVGGEQSIEAQQYLNSIAGETVVVPGNGPTIRASQVLKYYNKQLARKTISDARMENPPRKLTMESGEVTAAPATVAPATTASGILTALRAFEDDAYGGQAGQDAVTYKNLLGGQTVTMYDLYGNAVTVRAADMLRYYNKGFSDVLPTIAVTGTAITGGVTEAEIVNGGETLILTLTNGVWSADPTVQFYTNNRTRFFNGDKTGVGSFNNGVSSSEIPMVRTSDTVLTLTFGAAVSYAIASDEIVTIAIPDSAVVYPNGQPVRAPEPSSVTDSEDVTTLGLATNIVCTPATFTITAS